jgi:hypothetical protein
MDWLDKISWVFFYVFWVKSILKIGFRLKKQEPYFFSSHSVWILGNYWQYIIRPINFEKIKIKARARGPGFSSMCEPFLCGPGVRPGLILIILFFFKCYFVYVFLKNIFYIYVLINTYSLWFFACLCSIFEITIIFYYIECV